MNPQFQKANAQKINAAFKAKGAFEEVKNQKTLAAFAKEFDKKTARNWGSRFESSLS